MLFRSRKRSWKSACGGLPSGRQGYLLTARVVWGSRMGTAKGWRKRQIADKASTWKTWTTTADIPTASYRRMMAYQLRMQGKTFKEIGEVFGVSQERARQLVARAIRECSAGFRYQHKNAGVREDEAKMLMPLIDFLKEIANDQRPRG